MLYLISPFIDCNSEGQIVDVGGGLGSCNDGEFSALAGNFQTNKPI
jgi:hypothetical protein